MLLYSIKILKFLIFLIVLTFLFKMCFFKFDPTKYIKKEIGLDIGTCNIEKESNTHGGIHGDGDYLIVADCSKNIENIKKQISDWNKLPLSKNLQQIMYGGNINGQESYLHLAKDNNIPEIKNGYYLFVDRHRESKNINSDKDLFGRFSFNFTLIMFDEDTKKIYYYEFDT